MRTADLGRNISSRKYTEVHRLGKDRVVKLFSRNVPLADIERERRVTAELHGRGLPVPATDERLARGDDGRHGIVFERIAGTTIKALYKRAPWRIASLTRKLAEVHERSFGIDMLDGLRSQRTQLRERIARASSITLRERQQLLGMLDELPDAEQVCHGNFQPGNLIVDRHGELVILSWANVCVGNPASDIARTALILGVPGRVEGSLRALLASSYGNVLKKTYLLSAMQRRPELVEQLQPWLAINAAVRMEEGISSVQRTRLRKLVRSLLARHSRG